jgi:alkyl sulfatase BDS1-like metallo-beta-lactamase superfamily hydrolase
MPGGSTATRPTSAPAVELAAELASLVGGEDKLAERAKALAKAGKTRLAAHLIELASTTSPASADIQTVRARAYAQCVSAEASLIGKAIFEVYRRDAEARSTRSRLKACRSAWALGTAELLPCRGADFRKSLE